MLNRRISLLSVLAIVIASTISPLIAGEAAVAAGSQTLYVSTSGSGTTCSSSSPCSISQAQSNVRAIQASAGGNVTVLMSAGTYRITSPLVFGAADGGASGATVTWAAAAGAVPIVSGAQQVTGWSVYDSSAGIYQANTPQGLDSRDLFVNNALAPRASIAVKATDITLSSTGFTINNSALNYLSSLPEQSRIDFESTQSFTDRYSPVASISGTTVTMAQPAWNNNSWGYDTTQTPLGTQSFYLENSLSFLTVAGQWYLDPVAGKIYYKPASGVDPNSLDVELPRLQSLVDIGGTYAAPTANLAFQGIQFSHTSWLGPSSTNGYADEQTGGFMSGSYSYRPSDAFTSCGKGCAAFERARSTWNQEPAAVQVSAATNITFTGDVFGHLGQVGLGIGNDSNAVDTGVGLGASSISVIGNTFADDGGGAIVVGGILADAHHPSDTRMTNQNIFIRDNTVTDVSKDYKDNAGILSTYVTNAQIVHNEVENVPYDGIDTGYGWGVNDPGGSQDYVNRGYYTYNPQYTTATTLKNNIVANNLVHHTKTTFGDGGSIYNLSASPGSVISNNYVYDLRRTTGLYLDEGSRYLTLEGNVVQDAGTWAFANYNSNNNTKDNNLDSTWHNSGNAAGNYSSSSNNTITNDHTVSGLSWPPAALAVICGAGVEPAYRTALNANYTTSSNLCGWSSIGSGLSTTNAATSAAFSQAPTNGSVIALSAAGADIWGAGGEHSDAYGAIYRPSSVSSSSTVTAEVARINDTNGWAKTGVAIRNNLAQPGSATGYAVVVVTPGHGVSFQWDSDGDGYLDQLTTVAMNTSQPIWVRLLRNGSSVSGYYSLDGTTFTQIGSARTLTSPTALEDGGVITTSHDTSASATDFVANLQIVSSVSATYSTFATGQFYANQTGSSQLSVAAQGADIWGSGGQHDDAYGSVYSPGSITPTGSVTAVVSQQTDTNAWAKSGVVIRNNLALPGSSAGYAVMVVTPSNGVAFEWDSNGDGYLDQTTTTAVSTSTPTWVRLVRSSSQVTAYYSKDGTTFTQVGSSQTISGASSGNEDGGIITTSHDTSKSAANQIGAPVISN